jgi:flagellin-like hook-associated protein FlgL
MAVTSLSSGVRAALASLSSTAASSQQGQLRLATGKKVNSAVDSPVNFFTAQGLNSRASQLTDNLDGISNGIQTIQAASKGIDSINKLVTSLQSTVKQAQAEAASNRPKIAGATAFADATQAATAGKSIKDTALSKTVVGAVGATAIGVTAGTAGTNKNAVQIKAGNSTYTFNFTSTTTVRDLVNEINKSGIATAAVGDDGKFTVTGTGSDNLTVEAGTTLDTTGVFSAVAGDGTALFGATDNTDIGGTGTSAVRSSLIKQFNDLRDQVDNLAKDAGFNGTNLLGGDKLSVTFNEKTGTAKNKLDVQGDTVTSANLGIGKLVDSATAQTNGDFAVQNDSDLSKAADALTNSLSSLRATASTLGSNLSVVQTRQDFTKDLINTLTAGADNLTLADTNEEGAKLLALQTRQQLSQTALTLSNQADQAVLRLF